MIIMLMFSLNMVQMIIGGALGSILTIIFTFIINSKKVENDKYSLLFEKLMLDSDNLRKQLSLLQEDCNKKAFMMQQELLMTREKYMNELSENNKKLAVLENSVDNHHMQIIMLESSHSYSPYPIWLRDIAGILLYVNDAYVDTFLKPQGKTRQDVLGKTSDYNWPTEVSVKLKAFDMEILSADTGYNYYYESYLRLYDESRTIDKTYRVIKYKRYYEKSLIGITGMAIPPMRGENYVE